MKIIFNDMVGARNPVEESRKQLLEAKRKIYAKIRAQLAKERPLTGVCPRTQRTTCYDYSHLVRTCP